MAVLSATATPEPRALGGEVKAGGDERFGMNFLLPIAAVKQHSPRGPPTPTMHCRHHALLLGTHSADCQLLLPALHNLPATH